MNLDQKLINVYLAAHPAPLVFVTMSGAHLYGFASADSDYDLRGCHCTPVRQMVGLATPDETYEVMDKAAPIEMDLVTHDVRKFMTLLMKNNGYVLEQVFSPLIVQAAPEFEELKALAKRCITRHHKHHFLRFGVNQWEMVVKSGRPTVKGLLYTYRVLLAGIRSMRTGTVESNLVHLNQEARIAVIDDLIAKKISGAEKGELPASELSRHEGLFNSLCEQLEAARAASTLPEEVDCRDEMNDLLIRLRTKHLG